LKELVFNFILSRTLIFVNTEATSRFCIVPRKVCW